MDFTITIPVDMYRLENTVKIYTNGSHIGWHLGKAFVKAFAKNKTQKTNVAQAPIV